MKAPLIVSFYCLFILVGCYELEPINSTDEVKIDVSPFQGSAFSGFSFHAQFPYFQPEQLTWYFGDGYQAQGNKVEHSYASPGEYKVRLEYEYQEKNHSRSLTVTVAGHAQKVNIQSYGSIHFDSDHNDPNQPFLRNDVIAQSIKRDSVLSGILLQKGSCQAGALCKEGDIIDRYTVALEYGDNITIETLNGGIDIEAINSMDQSRVTIQRHNNGFYIAEKNLGKGQYQLIIRLGNGHTKAQYLININRQSLPSNKDYQPGKLIVLWQGQNEPELVDISDARLGQLQPNQSPPTLMQARSRLNGQKNVTSVSYNYIRRAFNRELSSHDTTSITKNFSTWMWPLSLQNINALWQPLKSRGQIPGQRVTVAILDTGLFFAHPNLSQLDSHSAYDFVSDPINSGDGNGWDNNPEDPGDIHQSYHGTHITGIIAAQPNPSHAMANITGIAHGVQIMPLRVLGLNGGTSYDLIQALRYAAGLKNASGLLPQKPADIINLSLGGSQFSAAEQATIDEVVNSGVIVVAAAGNEGNNTVNYPAAYSNVIAVGALNSQGGISHYSNSGNFLDIMAPGGECHTAFCHNGVYGLGASGQLKAGQDSRQATWQYLSGTSMAAAHVSALLAIVRSYLPALDSQQLQNLLMQKNITKNILSTEFSNLSGWGSFDTQALMELMDSSELSHGRLWSPLSEIYLDKGQSITLPIIQRGMSPSTITTLKFDASKFSVTFQQKKLTIKALTSQDQPQTIELHSQNGFDLSIQVLSSTANNQHEYLNHLYIELASNKHSLRASKEADQWSAYIPPLPVEPFIQASSDLDYDGIYCEPGEFCAFKQFNDEQLHSELINGELLHEKQEADIFLRGKILKH